MLNDSGDRTEYPSGAVRDMKKGKGRCDLLPLDFIFNLLMDFNELKTDVDSKIRAILDSLYAFQKTKINSYLYAILDYASRYIFSDKYTMLLELSIHFEEGAEKYGVDN